MNSLLQLNQITKSFGAVSALKGVSLDLKQGEVHALLGENGAGKSTLIKIITGAHQPDSGSIEIDGKQLSRLTPASAHASGIAAIYQQPALFPDLSVAENIALALEKPSPLRAIRWRNRHTRAAELLNNVGANINPTLEVGQLSMPEQQLVEIARAVGTGARILILDEPTASLTKKEVELLYTVVRELRSRGVGMIYISHRLEEIFAIADRVTVLRDGESVGTNPIDSINEAQLIRMMVGREVSTIYPPRETVSAIRGSSPSPPEEERAGERRPLSQSRDFGIALSVRNLACCASKITNVSFELRSGEILGLAGLVGAGRTELARILFGIAPADSGEILVNGQPVKIRTPSDAVEHGIAYVPEDRRRHGVILEMPVAANITMSIHREVFPGTWLRFDTERSVSENFVRDLAIKTSSVDPPASTLSGGNQQKVALARWLAAKPKILILDEPTQGVDVGAKSEIHKLIRSLSAQGLAVLMISSDLPEILGMSDRIAVMGGGTIVAMLPGNSSAHDVMSAALGQSK
ncbi:MAG: D-xylose ABC transporter ATP-binding protein [Acidobacteria bacterium]|nr:MAG: D-xylose ABC transporter ATP-binding protein [Acidobacteriota bacterium]